MDILTIGDVSIDLYMKIDEKSGFPVDEKGEAPKICFYHGSKIPVEHFETLIAGNSLNVGVGCKNLGLKTTIYTELGDDENADRIIDELKELDIETKYCVKNEKSPTNVHSVIVYGGDRTIFSYHEKRNYKIKNWDKPKWVYYTSMGEGFEEFQKDLIDYITKNPGIGVAFNPGTIQMRAGLKSFENFLKITDVLFLNREEAIKLVGKDETEKLHEKLHKLGPKLTVITEGKKGASAFDGQEMLKQKIYSDERKVVDKTGAGDAFTSGFLAALFYGKNLKEALKWGVANSGSVIKKIGANQGLCSKSKIEKIVKKI